MPYIPYICLCRALPCPYHELRQSQGSVGLGSVRHDSVWLCNIRGSKSWSEGPLRGGVGCFCLKGDGGQRGSTGCGLGFRPNTHRPGDDWGPRGGPGGPRPGNQSPPLASSSMSRTIPYTHALLHVLNPARSSFRKSLRTVSASRTVLRQPPPWPRPPTRRGRRQGHV